VKVECGALAFLLRALGWLELMGRALLQARRWLGSRFCWVWAAEHCWRDARTFGRLAGQDLRMWCDCTVSRQEAVSGPVASWREFPACNVEVLP
jgi:hypothetical protein